LPTGSGKTFIAVMLIKELSLDNSITGKRSVFLANNVPLVQQQAKYIRENTFLNVGEYYGDCKINGKILDSWNKEIWDKEIANNEILVMSAQILVGLLTHSFLGGELFSLLSELKYFFLKKKLIFVCRNKHHKSAYI
jgi:endoribonuclease Dicer